MVAWHTKQISTRWPMVVIVRSESRLSSDQMVRIRDVVARQFRRTKVLVIDSGLDIEIRRLPR
jgi:hypothetical protein